ncbi:glycosyltransferase [Vibrio breoganii]|uniref:glycosyltransferase n=1 Tax=Vibrio breoganii TaxID=553239 RepID=UPI0003164063|nr:glycosyltransferase [Vibrio breoganii]OEF81412.1 hypothetical protein B003_12585 [Vibrio breoganii 1C10]
MPNIIVNATALSSSGALTILKQFLSELKSLSRSSDKYIVFVSDSIDFSIYECLNVEFIYLKVDTWFKRIVWDWHGIKKYLNDKDIEIDLLVSMQNTTVNINCPQFVYLHQSIPFNSKKWNLLKKDEIKFYLYKHFYPFFIFRFIRHDTVFIVQTNWMKHALVTMKPNLEGKVEVIKPKVELGFGKKIRPPGRPNKNKIIFYPATNFKYKNHLEIVLALDLLISSGRIDDNVVCYFTIDNNPDCIINKTIANLKLCRNFKMLGTISYESVLEYYNSCDLVVFPSYLETLGLPLLEAACHGKPIIAANEPFASEVLDGYSNVKFASVGDTKDWANCIYSGLYEMSVGTPYIISDTSSWNMFFNLIEGQVDNV